MVACCDDCGVPNRIPEAVERFCKVRDMRYAFDAAHSADDLLALGAGDCLAKSELLARWLNDLGFETRFVRWRYLLPDVVSEVFRLPSRLDVHRAIEVRVEERWLLVDPTHDPALAQGGFTVADWDGRFDTPPAYTPLGPRLIEGIDDAEIDLALVEITRWTELCEPELLASWRSAYAGWLTEVRKYG